MNTNNLIRLNQLSEIVAEKGYRIAVIFEGRDSAGKSGTIAEITKFLPIKNHSVELSPKPSKTTMRNWFKHWKKRLPEKGTISFFDRSWYSRALVQPANNWCSEKQYKNFMLGVNDWEKNQPVIYIKIWCSISRVEQSARLHFRKNDPLRYWKFSPNDAGSLDSYDKITLLKEELFQSTNDWKIIDYNNKDKGRENALKYIISRIEKTLYK